MLRSLINAYIALGLLAIGLAACTKDGLQQEVNGVASSEQTKSLQEAKAAAERGDYAIAMKKWLELGKNGNVEAQLALGIAYQGGPGMMHDPDAAEMWYGKAAVQGNASAQLSFGLRLMQRGLSIDMFKNLPADQQNVNRREGVAWVRKSAEQGNIVAQHSLAGYYETGNGVMVDYSEAVRWYMKAANQANGARSDQLVADSEHRLGELYLYGIGVVADPEKAAYWTDRANAHGYIPPPPRPPIP
jgi:TPR repeat protein